MFAFNLSDWTDKSVIFEFDIDRELPGDWLKLLHSKIKESKYNVIETSGKMRSYKLEYRGMATRNTICRFEYKIYGDFNPFQAFQIDSEAEAVINITSDDWFISSICSLICYFPTILK